MGQLIHIHHIDTFAKVVLVALVAVAASAENRFSGYNQDPPQQTYQEPEPIYRQPERQPAYSNPRPTYEEPQEGMPFNYNWAVKDDYSGNDYNHRSESDGDLTQGEYRVLLPDGRTQIVTYRSDKNTGFVAEVTYEGEARAYQPQASSNTNRYKAPEPQNTYQQPRTKRPRTYQPPTTQATPTYVPPQPTYQQPQQTYQQPQNTYQQPRRNGGFF